MYSTPVVSKVPPYGQRPTARQLAESRLRLASEALRTARLALEQPTRKACNIAALALRAVPPASNPTLQLSAAGWRCVRACGVLGLQLTALALLIEAEEQAVLYALPSEDLSCERLPDDLATLLRHAELMGEEWSSEFDEEVARG